MDTTALEPLGMKWQKDTLNPKMFSHDDIVGLQNSARQSDPEGKLGHSINAIGKIDTSMVDCVRSFAAANGWVYRGAIGSGYDAFGLEGKAVPAWMAGFRSFSTDQVYCVAGQIEGYETLMFVDKVVTSQSTTNGTKSTPHYRKSGVICVQLGKVFPQLVLDSNKNDKFFMKIRSSQLAANQKINLEGNFSQYFDFYAPQGIGASALTVLSPNFMQQLIDASATFDVEIIGDKLYILTQDPLYTANIMGEALRALTEQLRYMRRLETSWNYTPLVQPFDTLVRNDRVISSPYSFKIGPLRVNLLVIILAVAFGLLAAMLYF